MRLIVSKKTLGSLNNPDMALNAQEMDRIEAVRGMARAEMNITPYGTEKKKQVMRKEKEVMEKEKEVRGKNELVLKGRIVCNEVTVRRLQACADEFDCNNGSLSWGAGDDDGEPVHVWFVRR